MLIQEVNGAYEEQDEKTIIKIEKKMYSVNMDAKGDNYFIYFV